MTTTRRSRDRRPEQRCRERHRRGSGSRSRHPHRRRDQPVNGRASRRPRACWSGLRCWRAAPRAPAGPSDGSAPGRPTRSPSAQPSAVGAAAGAVTHVAGRLSPQKRTAVAAGVRRALASTPGRGVPRRRLPPHRLPGRVRLVHGHHRRRGPATTRRCSPTGRSGRAPPRCARCAARRTSRCSRRSKVSAASPPRSTWCSWSTVATPPRAASTSGSDAADPDKHGRWAVFGYDLNRSQTATGRGPDDADHDLATLTRRGLRRVWCWRWCSPSRPRGAAGARSRHSDASLVDVQTAQAVDHPDTVVWVLCLGSDARPGPAAHRHPRGRDPARRAQPQDRRRHDDRHPARLLRRDRRPRAQQDQRLDDASAARS